MKRVILVVLAFVVFMSTINAEARGLKRSFRGCNDLFYGGPNCGNVTAFKDFRKETLPLREQLNNKRFELEKELLSDNPDKNKINQLEKEISMLWTELEKVREKHREQIGKGRFNKRDGFKWGGPIGTDRLKTLSPELKELRKETFDLRQKLTEKKFMLEKELLSDNPDNAKIDALRKEVDSLAQELDKIREKHRAKYLNK
jgi:Spy/CpxP family protein refolding chaperone